MRAGSAPAVRLARALRRADFERARVSGARSVSKLFISLAVWRGDERAARLGITVTRKVGKAVRRNRIKRLVREWFRSRRDGLGAWDLVVIAKQGIAREGLACADVARDLDAAWRRLETCKPHSGA